MRRLAPSLLIVAVVLAAAVNGAPASRLSLSGQRFRLVWATEEPLVIRKAAEPNGADDLFHCPVTLEGSFHSATMVKLAGQLDGLITSTTLGACSYERSWFESIVLLATEWHLVYDSFSGTLPLIASVRWRLIGFGFSARERGFLHPACLWLSTASSPLYLRPTRESGGALAGAALEGTLPRSTGEGSFCVGSSSIAGVPTLTASGGTAALTVTLI